MELQPLASSSPDAGARFAETLERCCRSLPVGTDTCGEAVSIRYAVLGTDDGPTTDGGADDPRPRVVMLMGLAASMHGWKAQVEDLLLPLEGDTCSPVVMCLLDNRGVGGSASPRKARDYSTAIMADDTLALLDHLKWDRVHVVGFSMGGMVATRLAAAAPRRVATLSIISSTTGGFASLPRSLTAWKYIVRLLRSRTAAARAHVDLKFHFSHATRSRWLSQHRRSRHEVLHAEYLQVQNQCEQPAHGLHGQVMAVFKHSVPKRDAQVIQDAGIPVLCMHGRHDLIAGARAGEALARRLGATMVLLEGAHFIPRECGHAISLLLEGAILGQPRMRERAHLDPERHLEPCLPAGA